MQIVNNVLTDRIGDFFLSNFVYFLEIESEAGV